MFSMQEYESTIEVNFMYESCILQGRVFCVGIESVVLTIRKIFMAAISVALAASSVFGLARVFNINSIPGMDSTFDKESVFAICSTLAFV